VYLRKIKYFKKSFKKDWVLVDLAAAAVGSDERVRIEVELLEVDGLVRAALLRALLALVLL
jgi:hypothetical protein